MVQVSPARRSLLLFFCLLLALCVAQATGCDKKESGAASGGAAGGGGAAGSGGGGGGGSSSGGGGGGDLTSRTQATINVRNTELLALQPAPADLEALKAAYQEKYGRAFNTTDLWGNPYQYEVVGGKPSLVSSGPDGEPGTADDISSQN